MGSFTAESESSYTKASSDSVLPCSNKKELSAAPVALVVVSDSDEEPIEPFASNALKLAVKYSLESTESDGHYWYGEQKYACSVSASALLRLPFFPFFTLPSSFRPRQTGNDKSLFICLFIVIPYPYASIKHTQKIKDDVCLYVCVRD